MPCFASQLWAPSRWRSTSIGIEETQRPRNRSKRRLLRSPEYRADFIHDRDPQPVEATTAPVTPTREAPPLSTKSPGKQPRPPLERVNFERARNLLPIVDEVEGKQDVASLTIRARALEECRLLAVAQNYFDVPASDLKKRFKNRGLADYKRFTQDYLGRCGDLAQVRHAKAAETTAAIREAAAEGSAWANAVLYRSDTMNLPMPDADAKLKELLGSGDPYAIGALADDGQLWRPRDGSEYADLAGSQLSPYAWELASCALGRDCTADGDLMRQMCIFGGFCSSASNYQELLEQDMLTPAEFLKVQQMESAVLAAIKEAKNGRWQK